MPGERRVRTVGNKNGKGVLDFYLKKGRSRGGFDVSKRRRER